MIETQNDADLQHRILVFVSILTADDRTVCQNFQLDSAAYTKLLQNSDPLFRNETLNLMNNIARFYSLNSALQLVVILAEEALHTDQEKQLTLCLSIF